MSDRLHIRITGDNSSFIEAINGARNGVRQTQRQVEESGESIESMFQRIQTAASLALAGFSAKEFIQKCVSIRGEFQQLEIAFSTMLGSAEKANALMNQLVKTAATTPFDLQGVADGAKQLLAYGTSAEEVNNVLIHLGDIAAGLSLPLGDLVYLYGTTMTQGRMFTQDLRQFMGRGIPIADELAKQFGVTKDKVGELVTAGKVGAEEFNKAIMSMSSEGGKFGGLMEAQSKSITGQISNIEDAIDVMFNEIGKQQEGIINSSLDVVSSLVENYEKVGKVLVGLVATYGTYKAALMTVTALQSLQAIGISALTAKEIVHYGWLVLVQKAQALLNATMLANPYVLAATALAGVAAAMWALHDSTTAEEAAQKSLNETMEELNEKQKHYNEETEKAIGIAQDDAAATSDRDEAMQLLIARYPEIIKKYIDEEGHLHDILKLKKEIASFDGLKQRNEKTETLKKKGENAYSLYNELAGYRKRQLNPSNTFTSSELSRIEAIRKAYKQERGLSWYNTASLEDMRDYYKNVASTARNQYARNLTENRISDFTSEGGQLEKYTDAQLKALQKSLRDNQIENKKNTSVYIQEIGDYLTYSDRESLLTRVDGMVEARGKKKYTPSQQKAELKKELEEAQKALAAFDSSDTKYTTQEAEKQRKKLQDAVDEAEKKYKAFGGNSLKNQQSEANKRKREQEKQQRNDEQANQLQLKLRQQAEDGLTSIMDEGYNKRIKEIEDGYKKELAEIDKNEKAIKEKRGGTLTADDIDALTAAREASNKKYLKDIADVKKEELSAMYDYLKEYGSFEQQKLAITEDYEQRIKDASTKGEKLRLQKEKEKALSNLSFENISMGIDWSALLSGIGSLSHEMLKPMLEQLEAYTKTEDYGKADMAEREKVAELIQELRQYIDTDQNSTWNELAAAITNFSESVSLYKEADKNERKAVTERDDAKKRLEKGDISQEEFDKFEQAAQELGRKTVEARDEMQKLGASLNDVSDNIKNYVSPLTAALNKLDAWKGIAGFDEVQSSVAAFDKLKGTLDSVLPNMGEGMAKKIGTNMSSVLGSSLSSIGSGITSVLSSGVGSIIGIVAQIPRMILDLVGSVKSLVTGVLDSFTELISLRWIDDLVVSILDSVGNLINAIFDLPENLYKVLEGIIWDGVGGLLDSVIGRLGNILSFGALGSSMSGWFTNSNAKEVAETTERLTDANERLKVSIDGLKDEISDSSGSSSIKSAKEALDAQKKYIENQREILKTQQGYHNAHHSNAYYWNLGQGDQMAVNNLLAEYARKNGKNASKVDSTWGSFSELSPEEMDYIRTHDAELWRRLTDIGKYDKSEYFDAFADLAGSEQEILDNLNEALTQTSFDTLKSDFISNLMDMETSAEDFADNFSEMMMQAILNARISDLMDDQIQAFYDKWAELSKDASGNGYELTDDELDELSKMWDGIVQQGLRIRDEVADITGYTGGKSSAYEQNVSTGAWQSMSEDTGQELNGRFTALQVTGENISEGIVTLIATMTSLSSFADSSNTTLIEIRNLMVFNNAFLEDILEIAKKMHIDFNKKLDKITVNTK